MSYVQAADIPDIIAAGLAELGEGKMTDLTSDTQEYVAFTSLMRKPRVEIQDSGHSIQWDLMTDHNNSARAVGLYSTDNVNVPNVLTQASIPWRHVEGSYAFDHHEIDMNGGPRRIVNLMKTRRYAAMVSMAEFFEDRFWRLTPADDAKNMLGVPNWIVKNAVEGFNGGAPTGYTTVAGLNPAQLSRWKNYTAPYAAVSFDDLIVKLEKAMDFTKFTPPAKSGIGTFNTGDKYGLYTTYRVYSAAKQLLRSQNENLGFDLDPMDGRPTFRRAPLTWVPQLDADTTDPVYGINWGEFKLAILASWWMKEKVIKEMPGQHNVTGVFIDCSLNTICRNRRRNFVVSNGTSLPTD